ncbi:hypothetical protein JOF53_004202 [Crossiella equi]|uniref:Uncharacterized protein n=1 Tax=Crossiella equi TaxID=130796 RepID=A0ABS5AI12_9PSEU|nr:hypothetical protein [Crossiella equi]MBP2475330.1 hypothetical protein [Crossiella equi]
MTRRSLRDAFLPFDARLGAALGRLRGTESELRLRGAWAAARETERVLAWLLEGRSRPESFGDWDLGVAWLGHCLTSAHYTDLLAAHTGLARRLCAGTGSDRRTASRLRHEGKEGG